MGSTQGRPVLREVDRRLLSSQSGLQEQEVEDRFQEFLRRHPDGKLRQADFSCMMSQVRWIMDRIDKNYLYLKHIVNSCSFIFLLSRLCQKRTRRN